MKEFFDANKGWMDRLAERVRAALRDFPAAFLGENGADFLYEHVSDTALAYSVLQVMRPGPGVTQSITTAELPCSKWD